MQRALVFLFALATLFAFSCAPDPVKPEEQGSVRNIEGQLYKDREMNKFVLVSGLLILAERPYHLDKYPEALEAKVSPACTYKAKLRVRVLSSDFRPSSPISVEVLEIVELNWLH